MGLAHPLVKVKPLRAPHHFALILNKLGGVAVENKVLLEPVEDRVDQMALTDLLRILRQFELDDPANVFRLMKRLINQPVESTMKSAAKAFRDEFLLKRLPKHLQWSEILPGFDLTPKTAYDLYLYGGKFHHDRVKRERWKALCNSRFEPVLYSAVLHAAVAKANAIIELYRVLRVHGHVRPVPGTQRSFLTRRSRVTALRLRRRRRRYSRRPFGFGDEIDVCGGRAPMPGGIRASRSLSSLVSC